VIISNERELGKVVICVHWRCTGLSVRLL